MALFRKFFYRKPPDGLLEISERVYVFDCCFTTDVLEENEYKVYIGGIVSKLREHLPDASFMVFNFREGENQSQISNVLSKYNMTVMDYPRHFEGCPLLTMEMVHHFLRSSESWLLLGQQNVLLMHCERGGWPVLAFMLAALLIYRKQYSGEQKTLDMIYKQAPRELLQLMSPLNPLPSQLRYLQYVSRRNVGSEWPPLDRALTLDCIIIRFIPNMVGEGGCRPIFRIYGQDPFMAADRTPKVLFSTPKRSKLVRYYKQADSELVKIDIHCHIQGDVVLECISLEGDLEREQMMFRVMFNTAFIRSNILMLNRDDIDILWTVKDQFPKDFRAEVLFSEMDSATSLVSIELPNIEDREGLPIEAFDKVKEIFSNVDWLDPKTDALSVLQQITTSNVLQEKVESSSFCPAETGKILPESTPEEVKVESKASEDKITVPSSKKSSPEEVKVESEPLGEKITIPSSKNQMKELVSSSSLEASLAFHSIKKKIEPLEVQVALQQPTQSKIISQRKPHSSLSAPVSYCNSLQGSPVPISRYHSAPSSLGITALLHDHDTSKSEDIVNPVVASSLSPSTSSSLSNVHKPLQPGKLLTVSPPPSLPFIKISSSTINVPTSTVQISLAPPQASIPQPVSGGSHVSHTKQPKPASPSRSYSLSLPSSAPNSHLREVPPSPANILSPIPPPPPPLPPSSSINAATSIEQTSSAPLQASIPRPILEGNHVTHAKQPKPASSSGSYAPSLPSSLPNFCLGEVSPSPTKILGPVPPPILPEPLTFASPPPPPPPPGPLSSAPPPPAASVSLTSPSSSVKNSFSAPPPPTPPSLSETSTSTPFPPPPSPPPGISSFASSSSSVASQVPTKNLSSTSSPPPPPPGSSVPPPPAPPLSIGSSTGQSAVSSVPPSLLPLLSTGSAMRESAISSVPPPPPPPLSSGSFGGHSTISLVRPPPPPPPPLTSGSSVGQSTASTAPPPPPPPNNALKDSSSKNAPPVPPPPILSVNGLVKAGGASPQSNSAAKNGNVPAIPGPPSGVAFNSKPRSLSRTSPKNQALSKKSNLKPYHWLKLTRAMQGSLWAEAQKADEASKTPEFDMTELESLFAIAAPNSDHGTSEKSNRRASGPKPEKVQLIELRRAYNCEIMLTKVKVPLPDLMSSVLALDEAALDVDQVENLIKFCPTKEEMEQLKAYTGDKENLGKCEQFFLELMKVPRVESKLRVFSFKIQFRTQVSDLRNSLNIVNSASEEIRSSAKLKRIMQTILSLGNALNHGTARGSAIGFRLDSLLKLTDTRARNNKMTLMHYLCKVLAEKLPELLDFQKDLVSLEASTKIQLKYLAEEMQAISKGLEKVVQELTTSENDGPVSDSFCKILKEFLGHAEADVRCLTSLYSSVGRNADALALYFGEDPARCPFEQVVSTLLNFVRMFVRAHEDNCKQLELERRKAEKEVEIEKMKISTPKKESERIMRTAIKSGNLE